MSEEFSVVTNVKRIAELNRILGKNLAKTFKYPEPREITYPSGHFRDTVRFSQPSGTLVEAWVSGIFSNRRALYNFILVGEPKATAWLEISAQLNFPADKYSRAFGGAFVEDSAGQVFVAHRGKLTKGNAGLKKQEVLREFSPQLINADDDGKPLRLILISSLDDPALPRRLCDFAIEAREVARKLGRGESNTEQGSKDSVPPSNGGNRGKLPPAEGSEERGLKLRAYFDEHAGTTDVKGHGGGKRTVEHGDVVKALEAYVRKHGETYKAQPIDLSLVTKNCTHLYEVKTSARTTDVYTGVGQLLIHGGSITELFGLPVNRYLVLPERPRKDYARQIEKKGAMQIVTYQRNEQGYLFEGL